MADWMVKRNLWYGSFLVGGFLYHSSARTHRPRLHVQFLCEDLHGFRRFAMVKSNFVWALKLYGKFPWPGFPHNFATKTKSPRPLKWAICLYIARCISTSATIYVMKIRVYKSSKQIIFWLKKKYSNFSFAEPFLYFGHIFPIVIFEVNGSTGMITLVLGRSTSRVISASGNSKKPIKCFSQVKKVPVYYINFVPERTETWTNRKAPSFAIIVLHA